jgi:hypothetical protein
VLGAVVEKKKKKFGKVQFPETNNEGRFVHGVVKQTSKFSFPMKSILRIWNIGNIAKIQE